MTITSVGYAGTITDENFRRMATQAIGSLFGVDDYTSFRVTAGLGDRALSVSEGGAFGLGVRDFSDAPITLTGSIVTSGSRWDLVCVRRNWATGTTTVGLIEGTSTKAIPSRNTGFEDLNDQPIALVRFQAGRTAVQEIVDLRCIPADGGMLAFDTLTLSYVSRVGTQVRIGDYLWSRIINPAGSPSWRFVDVTPDTGWVDITLNTGWTGGWGEARRIGQQVFLRITRTRAQGWSVGGGLAALSAPYRPDVPWYVGSTHSSGRSEFVVNTNGAVNASSPSGGATAATLNTSYPAAGPTL